MRTRTHILHAPRALPHGTRRLCLSVKFRPWQRATRRTPNSSLKFDYSRTHRMRVSSCVLGWSVLNCAAQAVSLSVPLAWCVWPQWSHSHISTQFPCAKLIRHSAFSVQTQLEINEGHKDSFGQVLQKEKFPQLLDGYGESQSFD
jgi:hypothetical protein